jgi:hypothetical protein
MKSSIQGKLNRLARQFQPRKSERICYNQPRRIAGRDTYIQPGPCDKTNSQRR